MNSITEIKKQLKTNGFHAVVTTQPYLPLKLKAFAVGEWKKEFKHYPKEEVVETKRVLGESLTRFKFFEDGQIYDIQCMYGMDDRGDFYLFCKEDKDKDAFKILNGSFVFEFSSEQFYYLLTNVCVTSWALFASSCVCNNRSEVEKFEKLVKDNIADDGRKTRAYSLINRLYYNLDNK